MLPRVAQHQEGVEHDRGPGRGHAGQDYQGQRLEAVRTAQVGTEKLDKKKGYFEEVGREDRGGEVVVEAICNLFQRHSTLTHTSNH